MSFWSFFSPRAQFRRAQMRSPEENASKKSLGVQSIIASVIGTVMVIVFVLLGALCSENFVSTQLGDGNPDFPVASLIGAIAFFGLAFFGLMVNLYGISFATIQRKINKLTIGKVALIISLVCLLISIVGAIVLLVVLL